MGFTWNYPAFESFMGRDDINNMAIIHAFYTVFLNNHTQTKKVIGKACIKYGKNVNSGNIMFAGLFFFYQRTTTPDYLIMLFISFRNLKKPSGYFFEPPEIICIVSTISFSSHCVPSTISSERYCRLHFWVFKYASILVKSVLFVTGTDTSSQPDSR